MNEFYYNSEGYYDPTMGAALNRIWNEEKKKAYLPRVLILSDDDTLPDNLFTLCRPVFMSKFLDCHLSEYIQIGEDLMNTCDEVWVRGDCPANTLLIHSALSRGLEVRFLR